MSLTGETDSSNLFLREREVGVFTLAAGRVQPGWSGEVARAEFSDLAEAEAQMRRWARFGVDAYCNDPDHLWIVNAGGEVVRVWDWRTRRSVPPPPPEGQASGA